MRLLSDGNFWERTGQGNACLQEGNVIAAPRIELATQADLNALAEMRVESGWHRNEPILASTLAWERGRIFVVRAGSNGAPVEEAGRIAATTSAIAAGPIGVIGNVSVRPEFRRLGLGRLLTAHAVEWMRSQGVRTAWLDATVSGRPLYQKLGFTETTESWVVHTPMRNLDTDRVQALAAGFVAEVAPPETMDTVAHLDLIAFGGDRFGLLRALAGQPGSMLLVAHRADDDAKQPLGYALTRRFESPYTGTRVGPMVATDDHIAAALVLAAIRAETQRSADDVKSGAAFFSAGGGEMPHARAFFDSIGAETQDDDIVMRLDLDNRPNGSEPPTAKYAEKARLYSWSSSMLF